MSIPWTLFGSHLRTAPAADRHTPFPGAREYAKKTREFRTENYVKWRLIVTVNLGYLILVDAHDLRGAQRMVTEEVTMSCSGSHAIRYRVSVLEFTI